MLDRTARLGSSVVVIHAVVVLLHSRAHDDLGVDLNAFQQAFAAAVIVIAPFVAAALLWGRHQRVGGHLLWMSMAGALVFGVYHHYVAISPDHVAHLPPGDAQSLFRWTASLLPVTELAGLLVGVWAARSPAAQRRVG